MYSNAIPAGEIEGAFKEKVHASFFNVGIIDGTVVVILLNIFLVFSLSLRSSQKKEFVFSKVTSRPHPGEER
jgi:hypothetical protein